MTKNTSQSYRIQQPRPLRATEQLLPSLFVACLACFAGPGPASALHIVPDRIDDPHFTSGPCPKIVPMDGAACPNGASTCPAFYDPELLPHGYDSVSYCANVPALTFGATGFTLMTTPLNRAERKAFLIAAHRVESYVKDDVTVVIEPYKVAYLSAGVNYRSLLANEYWNPVCAADAMLPPFTDRAPTIVKNADGSYSYKDLPETYTQVLNALKRKNAENEKPMELIDHLPDHDHINVEWPASFFAWQDSTNLASQLVSNFLVGTSGDFPITPGAKPFTLCAAPAAMKMLGFAPLFHKNGHDIDEINSPRYNMNVTLPGTDGALVVADFTDVVANGPPGLNTGTYFYDPNDPAVVNTQLPKAYFMKSLNLALSTTSCADPTQCQFPQGVNPGLDLTAFFNHEINHVLGIMQSQYFKGRYEGTSLAYTYGTALFLLDLFDLDSDYVVAGYGHPGIRTHADFTTAPRNNDTYVPKTSFLATTAAGLTPWIQFGARDHVVVYNLEDASPRYFPLENYSIGNPDGDIGLQVGLVEGQRTANYVLLDPNLVNLLPLDVIHPNVESFNVAATIGVNTIREYSELATEGWDIDYSTLKNPYKTKSPVAQWYQTCFDSNGFFTTSKNKNCKFSVLPKDLEFLD